MTTERINPVSERNRL